MSLGLVCSYTRVAERLIEMYGITRVAFGQPRMTRFLMRFNAMNFIPHTERILSV